MCKTKRGWYYGRKPEEKRVRRHGQDLALREAQEELVKKEPKEC
jgi:hypothetical protein